jgi:hypothetical protein
MTIGGPLWPPEMAERPDQTLQQRDSNSNCLDFPEEKSVPLSTLTLV